MLTRSAVLDRLYNVDGTGVFQHNNYTKIIDALKTNSVFTVNFMEDNMYDYLCELDPTEFKTIIKEALFLSLETRFGSTMGVRDSFKDITVRLISDSVELMHTLNARDHENTVVVFDCEIIASEREKTFIKKCTAFCPTCAKEEYIFANEDREIGNFHCSNIKCQREKLIILKKTMITDNLQVIYLQEPMSTSLNSTPVMLKGLLIGALSGRIFIGQKKRITGIFKSVINPKANVNDIIVEIISEVDLDEKLSIPLEPVKFDEVKSLIKNESEFIVKITKSFAPLILGYEDIKLSILLMLVGGHSKVKREDINMFLIGDPSMAKSEMLKFAHRITDKSMYTSGRGASAAGLTIGLVKMENGNYTAQAGVLPRCSGGFAFIDEFDKMNTDDRSSLHEAMEQQTVSIAKAGFRMTLPAKTPILAAANPQYGKYDTSQTIIDNINIPLPLLSRFDMIWLIKDIVNTDKDIEKAQFILDTFTDGIKLADVLFNEVELHSYINHARIIEPILSEKTKQRLIGLYTKMRQSSNSPNSIAVGTRQLEALVRLTVAHAKLLLKATTDDADVDCIERLFTSMFAEFDITLDGATTFNQNKFYTTATMNTQQLIDHIWSECKDNEDSIGYNDYISKLVASGKLDEKNAKNLFDKMDRQCMIKHIGNNRWKKVQ